MKKSVFTISIIMLILVGTLVTGAQPLLDQPLIKNVIRLGEVLEYSVKIKGVPAGTQIMRVDEKGSLNGREVYHVKSIASANRFFNILYPFNDESDSFITRDNFHPLYFSRKLRDGRYNGTITVDFDDSKKIARIVKDKNRQDISVPKGIQDELSMLYFLRTRKIEVGREYEFPAIIGTKMFKIGVTALRIEEIKTIFGTIKTMVLKSFPREITLWVTQDDNRIPVKLEVATKLGKLVAELKDIH